MDQYSKVLLPSKETLAQLKARTRDGARWADLEVARRRARWEQVKREQDKKREDDKEAERHVRECFGVGLPAGETVKTPAELWGAETQAIVERRAEEVRRDRQWNL